MRFFSKKWRARLTMRVGAPVASSRYLKFP